MAVGHSYPRGRRTLPLNNIVRLPNNINRIGFGAATKKKKISIRGFGAGRNRCQTLEMMQVQVIQFHTGPSPAWGVVRQSVEVNLSRGHHLILYHLNYRFSSPDEYK
eukprot:gene16967-732_t